jgi:hypothetical protein
MGEIRNAERISNAARKLAALGAKTRNGVDFPDFSAVFVA